MRDLRWIGENWSEPVMVLRSLACGEWLLVVVSTTLSLARRAA